MSIPLPSFNMLYGAMVWSNLKYLQILPIKYPFRICTRRKLLGIEFLCFVFDKSLLTKNKTFCPSIEHFYQNTNKAARKIKLQRTEVTLFCCWFSFTCFQDTCCVQISLPRTFVQHVTLIRKKIFLQLLLSHLTKTIIQTNNFLYCNPLND